ncbi:MAG TPA: class I SAM-dependent methyltransferase [Thermoanaerobaculia bacterium]|nr:class I SAM-dependent methyltransferase [Thermoanaerobaculia bacterium]
MKREFVHQLRCVGCAQPDWQLSVEQEDEREIREGTLRCAACGSEHRITKGVADFLDSKDEGLQQEVKGWLELAGPLGEHLVPTMTALPYYPHDLWTEVGPDFFQVFEHFSFAGKKVVDLGAGRSWSSRHLATLGRASEIVAIDVLTTRFLGLETADIFFQEDSVFFERIRGDMHRIPLASGWADVVFACATLHHSSDLEALFREIRRVLRPGGDLIFISEPSKKASIQEDRPQNAETEHGINEHVYSLRQYLEPLRALGFRARRLVPRSIRYRFVYPSEGFQGAIPKALLPLTRTERGRDWIERLARSRLFGGMLYRYWSLPITVLAQRDDGPAAP